MDMHLRHAASLLLDFAIRIAPPDTRDWGQAMRSELCHVQGSWAALSWAFGSATVLAKGAVAAALIPGRRGQGLAPDGGLFAKSATARNAGLAAAVACLLVALLFFASPPFRQGFQVSLRPWHLMARIALRRYPPDFQPIIRRAEADRDAEGLAFCAIRVRDSRESARLAEEAVRLDPKLTWVYAVVAIHHPDVPQFADWAAKLRSLDPQNALVHLLAAGSLIRERGEWPAPRADQEQAWRDSMTAAFQSPKFDDHLEQVSELDRRLMARYDFHDPYELDLGGDFGLPMWASGNCERFAQVLIHSGADLETHGDRVGAREKYWTLARFGQLLDAQGRTFVEHREGTYLASLAYKQLQASFAREHRSDEAALFGYLAAKFDPITGEQASFVKDSTFGAEITQRNAAVVQASGLMMLVFCTLATIAAALLIVGGRRSAPSIAQRAKPMAAIVMLTSALGLLFSSVTLYLTYRPYWYMFQSALQGRGTGRSRDLSYFLQATNMLPGVLRESYLSVLLYAGAPSFLFYVWTGITLLSVIGLVLIILRHLLSRTRASPIT